MKARQIKVSKRMEEALSKNEEIDGRIFEGIENDKSDLIPYKDSIVHRFKQSYELTVAFLKMYLKEKCNKKINADREVFRNCFQHQIISETEAVVFLKIYLELSNINLNEPEVTYDLIDYVRFMNQIMNKLQSH